MEHQVDIVIITTLDIERNAVLEYLPNTERIVNRNRVYHKTKLYRGTDEYLEIVLLSLPYMGNANSSIAVTQAIDVWNPRYIIMTGISGGLNKESHHLGDVIVAEQIVYYESGKQFDNFFSQRFLTQTSSAELIGYAHNYTSEDWIDDIKITPPYGTKREPSVHFGIVGSGEKVIATDSFGERIKEDWPKMLAVEMEGYGSALASFQSENRPGFLLIKSICDWADKSKNDNWQLYSAHTAASYTINFLKSLIGSNFNLNRDRKQSQRKGFDSEDFNGRMKICLCKNLLDDWHDLADYFDIPPHQQRRFARGRECKGVWEWLESRGKLGGIEYALEEIDRDDLKRCFEKD